MVDRLSKNVHEVLSVSPDDLGMVKLAADGRTIYFHRARREADIWLATLK